MIPRSFRLILLCLFLGAVAMPEAVGQPPKAGAARSEAPASKSKSRPRDDSQKRAESLRTIAERLGVGPGSVIADIGAGTGRDTWTFADIVGENGKVFAEEIEQGKVDRIAKEAQKRGLSQVEGVLGTPTDPKLPAESVDLAFMHHVYHHVSKPREMLDGIWRALKPERYLVIIDQRLGTLVDWVPREERAEKHYWIAETTVVREAREQGFAFVEYAEEHWHGQGSFILVFQRPAGVKSPDGDPDPLSPLPAGTVEQLLPPPGQSYGRVAFVALGEGRTLIGPIVEATGCEAVDVVLEEWATQKDERPPLPAGVDLPSTLTERGDPQLGPEPIDAVYFLDTYHLLFHGPTLLARLRERLTASGRVYVLDRRAPETIPHREASHRRMIAPETVKQQMREAGFTLLHEGPPPAAERFLLVFGKSVGRTGFAPAAPNPAGR